MKCFRSTQSREKKIVQRSTPFLDHKSSPPFENFISFNDSRVAEKNESFMLEIFIKVKKNTDLFIKTFQMIIMLCRSSWLLLMTISQCLGGSWFFLSWEFLGVAMIKRIPTPVTWPYILNSILQSFLFILHQPWLLHNVSPQKECENCSLKL